TRTPSPTPSEISILDKEGLYGNHRSKNWRANFNKKNLRSLAITLVIVAIGVLLVVFNDQIVHAIEPTGRKIKALPGGWLIPVVILIVLSFPPLFGQEIVASLCGVIWGAGVGFAIVALGTILGEVASFYAFRYACRGRADKVIEKSIEFGLLKRIVQEGGFVIAIMIRLSAIPPHFATVVFSLCGMNILIFLVAAILTLPRQLAAVYLGVASQAQADHTETGAQRALNWIIIAVTIVVTIVSMRYIDHKVNKAKPSFIHERQKAR
ncbi:hypothetical protein K488DRAFT_20318, partial [Vararia minispora EC-137]